MVRFSARRRHFRHGGLSHRVSRPQQGACLSQWLAAASRPLTMKLVPPAISRWTAAPQVGQRSRAGSEIEWRSSNSPQHGHS
jgi:hypothetical protein